MTERQARHYKTAFLEAFRELGNVSAACRSIGLTNRTEVYRWQEHDDDFAAAYRQAEIESVDALESEARRRALGYEATQLGKDGTPYTVTRYSDVLLIFLLKGARPEKYRDNVDVNVSQVVRAYAGVDPDRV